MSMSSILYIFIVGGGVWVYTIEKHNTERLTMYSGTVIVTIHNIIFVNYGYIYRFFGVF